MKKYRLYLLIVKTLIVLPVFSLFILSCNEDNSSSKINSSYSVKIGITREPSAILPFKRNGKVERQIYPYIFPQITDFDPKSLKNTPTLIEHIPNAIKIDSGKYKGLKRYDFTFKKEAKWDNGTSITGFDYLFSIKLVLNPLIDLHPAIRSLYKNVKDIIVDSKNPRKISVYTINNLMLSKEMVVNMEIYPEYFYDTKQLLRKISFTDFLKPDIIKQKLENNKIHKDFAKKFNSVYFMRNNVSNCGPYKLKKWESNQYVELNKKNKYWGDNDSTNVYLQNGPDKIIFKVIPDKTTSLSELKNGNIDILQNVSGNDFMKMKKDSTYNNKFNFYNPIALSYKVLLLNNRKQILKDKNVRKALANLVNVDFLLKMFGTGNEKKIASPIHPSKPYYYEELKPISFDIDKSKELLKIAGWKDSNNDGILDKIIDGEKIELNLSITISSNNFSKSLALVLQENAKKAGINIKIINRGIKKYRKDKKSFNFDIIVAGSSKLLVDYDPYYKWHSDNIIAGGSNYSGFRSDKCDSIIQKIRTTQDKTILNKLYIDFQRIIYDEQAVIFLYVPTNNIIVNKKYKITTSVKRPGYFANTIELK